LVSNLADFHLFVSHKIPAVTAVTETWLNDQYTDTFVCPPRYTVFRKDRSSRGGGVAMFVRNNTYAEQVLINCVNNNHEVICVDLTLNSHKIRLSTCYRPPYYTADDVQYIESLVTVLLCVSAQQNVVLADFNLPRIDWSYYLAPTEPCHDKFFSFINNTDLNHFSAIHYRPLV